ncbi:MAG: DUF2806 domain-containing protein [Proteobacteria bacterium]|nr:DUF2806 domain-containing protein [Pseudomonadota bacterium]
MGDSNQVEEIGVSAELTPSGFSAKIKSRTASAWDRLWGSRVENKSIPIESQNAEAKALSDVRVKMIHALGDLGMDRLKSDPDFAARAVENFLPSLMRRQANKDAVLDLALEDLRQTPPSDDAADGCAEALDDTFLNRFERYAEEATTEQMRERWGKVLASEIRKPGTFTGKVLRVVDELDASTAKLFENLCKNRLGNVVPKSLLAELEVLEKAALTSAELIIEPGLGQYKTFVTVEKADQSKFLICSFGYYAIAFPAEATIDYKNIQPAPLISRSGIPSLPCYVLTETGHAIASILPEGERAAITLLRDQIQAAVHQDSVDRVHLSSDHLSYVAF